MNRRSFLQSCLAVSIAPYVITTSGLLMPLRKVWTAEAAGIPLVGVPDWFDGNLWDGTQWVYVQSGVCIPADRQIEITKYMLPDDGGRLKAQLRAAFEKHGL